MDEYAILSLQWYMPKRYVDMGYGEMPPGGRFVVWACCIEWPSVDYKCLYPSPPEGYVACITVETTKKSKRFSADGKALIRKKRLAQRIQKKCPLFANQAFEKSLIAKPDYFDPQAIAEQDAEFEKKMAKRRHEIDMSWVSP